MEEYSFLGRCGPCSNNPNQQMSVDCNENGNCCVDIQIQNRRVRCKNSPNILDCLVNPNETYTDGKLDLQPQQFAVFAHDIYKGARQLVDPCFGQNDFSCLPYSRVYSTNNPEDLAEAKCPDGSNLNYNLVTDRSLAEPSIGDVSYCQFLLNNGCQLKNSGNRTSDPNGSNTCGTSQIGPYSEGGPLAPVPACSGSSNMCCPIENQTTSQSLDLPETPGQTNINWSDDLKRYCNSMIDKGCVWSEDDNSCSRVPGKDFRIMDCTVEIDGLWNDHMMCCPSNLRSYPQPGVPLPDPLPVQEISDNAPGNIGWNACSIQNNLTKLPEEDKIKWHNDLCSFYCPDKYSQEVLADFGHINSDQVCDLNYHRLCKSMGCQTDSECGEMPPSLPMITANRPGNYFVEDHNRRPPRSCS